MTLALPFATTATTATHPDLPPTMQRPSWTDPVARLSLRSLEERPDGSGGDRWVLSGSSVAVMMAERLFSGTSANKAHTSVSWPAVEAMFADLLMLQHRFPIGIEPAAKRLWEAHYEDYVASFLHTARADDASAAAAFRGELRPFQRDGVRFLRAHRRSILADDMGLGKTPTALAFLAEASEWPAVIVCQSHVQRHWERKIEEFLDASEASAPLGRRRLTWLALRGRKPGRHLPQADVYLVHYLIMATWSEWLRERKVRAVVFDEVQELRHPGTRKFDANRAVAKSARIAVGLSGTPIYNKGGEIYNILNVLNRGCLGTKVDFAASWCARHDPNLIEEPAALGAYLADRGLMLRRRKEDVLAELPAKRRVIEYVDGDKGQFADLLKEAVRLAADAETVRDPFDRAKLEAQAIAQTRMATGVAKVAGVVAFLHALLETEQPTLVFAHHHAVHDAIADALDKFEPARITGQETVGQKDAAQKRFQSGATNLCLIALRAATGLDGLQKRARVVVFAEFDWSPAVHWQAEDRAHRMGQTDSVLAYYLRVDFGTDPAMMATLGLKESQFTGLMQDREQTEDDHAIAQAAAEQHKASVLRMLRAAA